MRHTLVGGLPRHLYVHVDSRFTHREPRGFVPAVWFGLVSYPGRMWGCTVMFETGAVYRNVPAHAIAFDPAPEPLDWSPRQAQTWDCYGWDFAALEYTYLRGLDVLARCADGQVYGGQYLFTVAPVQDGFSAHPGQAKEFSFIRLDNGRLTIQPTDRVLFRESSFTLGEPSFEGMGTEYRRQEEVWACE